MGKNATRGTLGFIGLGRMGSRIVENLLSKGFAVVAYNRSPEPLAQAKKKGAIIASDFADVAKKLTASPKIVWIMVSAGKPVDEVIEALIPHMKKGDILVDGGNSNYKDSVRRARALAAWGIGYLDIGTSGGLTGARNGACLTIGGRKEDYEQVKPILEAMSVKNGYLYTGASGSGHFVKTIHNAIEYGMLEAYGEGFEMLKKSPDYRLDLAAIAKVWGNGSVVRSWMLELAAGKLAEDQDMKQFSGEIGGGETGRWAAEYARARGVEIPVIQASLDVRGRKGDIERYAGKIVGAIRNAFGGHEMTKK